MGYLYTRPTTPPRVTSLSRPSPVQRRGFTAAPRLLPRQASPVARLRVENGGTDLGILPLVAAAIPSVSDLAKKAANSIIGIVDPGKKRDANRQARANMYRDLALQGSITAANRVYSAAIGIHGGEGPTKEANWYKAAWAQIQSSLPTLAAQAVALPRVGLPDPQEPTLTPADQQLIQSEINAFHGVASPSRSPVGAGFGGNVGMLLALGLVGAYFVRKH